MIVLAVDPGPRESAYVIWDGARALEKDNVPNDSLLLRLSTRACANALVIEQIRGFGIPAGNDLLDTCWWTGRFYQAWGDGAHMLPRAAVLKHFEYGGAGTKDAAVRAALIARFGPPGRKSSPGILYGLASHQWAALAVAVTFYDQTCKEGRL